MKLGLGTIEFAEKSGKHVVGVTPDEAREILTLAEQTGLRLLDTAAQVGNSAEILGRCLPGKHAFRLVAKTPHFHTEFITAHQTDQLETSLADALNIMQQEKAYALMIGLEDGLLLPNGEKLYQKMESLREQGIIEKIGVSVSNAAQVDYVLARFKPQLVQLPLNVLDQRLLHSGHLARLKQQGVEIHVRDVFLQGMLMDLTHLHPWFWPIRKLMNSYHDYLIAEGFTPLEGALGFVTAIPEVDYALVGVHSLQQLSEFITAADSGVAPSEMARFACPDTKYIDPLRWNLYE